MVAITLGVLVAIGVPNYRRVLERGYFRQAQDLLLTIYSGERIYQSGYNEFFDDPSGMAQWRLIHMDNPNSAVIPVSFSVTASGGAFTATAKRVGGPCNDQTLTINQDRVMAPDPATTQCWSGCGC